MQQVKLSVLVLAVLCASVGTAQAQIPRIPSIPRVPAQLQQIPRLQRNQQAQQNQPTPQVEPTPTPQAPQTETTSPTAQLEDNLRQMDQTIAQMKAAGADASMIAQLEEAKKQMEATLKQMGGTVPATPEPTTPQAQQEENPFKVTTPTPAPNAATQKPDGIALENVDRKAGERMTLKINNVEYAFRWCPPGTFMMGSPKDEKDRDDYPITHLPEDQHQVTLSRGFWTLETEVTQEMWTSMMGNNPVIKIEGEAIPVITMVTMLAGNDPKCPMFFITWNDCQEYIKKLNDLLAGTPGAPAGYKFSLPTETQWEYACRAGTTTAYHFGNTLNKNQANFGSTKPKKVGSYPANAWGLHDMHGNIPELCLDYYGEYPSGAVTDPVGVPSEKFKEASSSAGITVSGPFVVRRGGHWPDSAAHCRSAFRSFNKPDHPCPDGFRIVLICDEGAKE